MVSNLLAVLRITAKRIWANKVLTLVLLLGWTVAAALSLSVPLYSDAVNHRLLYQQLTQDKRGIPPYAFMFRYVGSWHGPLELEDIGDADAYLQGPVASEIGLRAERILRHVRTDNFRLFPVSEAAYASVRNPLEWVAIGTISDMATHITLQEGALPAQSQATSEALETVVYHTLANNLGLQVGEEYLLFGDTKRGQDGSQPTQIRVRIAGIWEAADPKDPYWFNTPNAFERTALVTENAFQQRIAPAMAGEVYLASWYMLLDGSSVYSEHVPALLGRIATSQSRAALLLPNIGLDLSPVKALANYRYEARLLTILLSVFTIPIFSLILYFVAQVAGMAVRHQQTEIAVLRSRGMTRIQILGVYVVQGLMLGALALVLAIPLGEGIALIMGQIRSFLTLVNRPWLTIRLTWSSLRFGLGAVLLALVTTLIPAFSAAGHTVVTHKQEQARSLRQPAWQRYFLDLFLLVPPLYGYYLLKQRGTLAMNLGGGASSDPFQNPLLFLVPTLFIFSTSLVFMRIFPLLMSGLAWLSQLVPGPSAVLALRHLARSARNYTGALLLLILTLGLAAFTASMALTLDGHLLDQVYYEVGSDLRLGELGESSGDPSSPFIAELLAEGSETAEQQGAVWLFLPVSQHLEVEGVTAAARVGRYPARSNVSGREDGTFVGVDRVDFAQVASFRSDYAPASLGELMNLLALNRRGVLVERGFLARNGLSIGNPLRLDLAVGPVRRTVEFVVVGVLDLLPTQYPEDGPFFLGNLDYAFQGVGYEWPYDVWLRTDGNHSTERIIANLEAVGFMITSRQDARELILKEQMQPARQGLFGVLSVGFLAAAGLTLTGFLLHSVFSFRQRFIELGVLRATGLSVSQMTAFLAGEQLALILSGAFAGTTLGILASRIFIPFLQVRGGEHAQTPPFVVQIAWGDIFQIYSVFGAMLLLSVAVTLFLLARMRVFEAIKLGEVG